MKLPTMRVLDYQKIGSSLNDMASNLSPEERVARGSYPENLLQAVDNLFEQEKNYPEDSYETIFECNTMFPLQRKREMDRMMEIARSISPQVIFDIGSDKGGPAYAFCRALKPKRMICCEVRGTPYDTRFVQHFPSTDFLFIEDSSYAISTRVQVHNWLGNDRIDVLFMDGDKGAFNKDWTTYKPMMSSKGIVLIHDVSEPGNPRGTFLELRGQYSHTETIIDTSESTEAMRREAEGIPQKNMYEWWLRHWKGSYATVGVIYLDSKKK